MSGTGLRLIGLASGPPLHRKFKAADGGSFELYRDCARFITVSGLAIQGADGVNGQPVDIDALLDELAAEATQAKQRKATQQAQAEQVRTGKWARGGMTVDLFKLTSEGVAEGERSDQFFGAVAARLDCRCDRRAARTAPGRHRREIRRTAAHGGAARLR